MSRREILTNGNAFKRTDGRWGGVVWYLDERGERKRKSFSGTTKSEVNKKMKKYIVEFNQQKNDSVESFKTLEESEIKKKERQEIDRTYPVDGTIVKTEKQKSIEVKEIRLSPNIDDNDLNTKVNNARKFIEKGNKVKVTLRFRGREMAHMTQTKYILDDFAEKLGDIAVVDKPAKVEGRTIVIFLSAKK